MQPRIVEILKIAFHLLTKLSASFKLNKTTTSNKNEKKKKANNIKVKLVSTFNDI